MQKVLDIYLKRLINLSTKNKSILLMRTSKGKYFDINDLDFINNKPSFSIIERLIKNKSQAICPLIESNRESTNQISNDLKKVYYSDKYIYEEQGARDLYVGWPFVQGKMMDESIVRAPLLLFPVTLSRDKKQWLLSPRQSEIQLNSSFLLYYVKSNQIPLDKRLYNYVYEDFTDSTKFKTQLYELFKNSDLKLHFSDNYFESKINSFTFYNRKLLEECSKKGILDIIPEAILGFFPQSGSNLLNDYEYLMDKEISKKFHFFDQSTIRHNLINPANIKEEYTFTPFRMDGWQETALKKVKLGSSVVIQGPPGSGKSQLISNLISDYIGRGKHVLFVSQKKVALDIVYQNLRSLAFQDFIGIIHDFKQDRRGLYEQLSKQINVLEYIEGINERIDTVNLERNFSQKSKRIHQITEQLTEYKEVLFDTKEYGISVKQLYLDSDLYGDFFPFKLYAQFPIPQMDKHLRWIALFYRLYFRLEHKDNFWKERISFENFDINDFYNIKKALNSIPVYTLDIEKEINEKLQLHLSFFNCISLYENKEIINQTLVKIQPPAIYSAFAKFYEKGENIELITALKEKIHAIMSCFKGYGPETSLTIKEIGQISISLKKYNAIHSNFISLIKWKLFSKDKFLLKRVLIKNDLQNNKNPLKILTTMVDTRLNLQHIIEKTKELSPLIEFPKILKLTEWENWSQQLLIAFNALESFNHLGRYSKLMIPFIEDYKKLKKTSDEILRYGAIAKDYFLNWSKYLSNVQINNIVNNANQRENYIRILNRDFDDLCAFDKLKNHPDNKWLPVTEKINEYIAHTPKYATQWEVNIKDTTKLVKGVQLLFKNSLCLAWIDHIEKKYPILKLVTSPEFPIINQELKDLISEKRLLTKDIILQKLREKTYYDVEYNRLNNRTTYRELLHQVSKKRRIWPIRKLLREFETEIFNLVPCWMASPESVSAIFPMSTTFDLVVFDEASQCFCEKGIPAIYRGKQTVISGDSQQLQPFDLYSVRYEEEVPDNKKNGQEEVVTLEQEVTSLLDLSQHYLENIQLHGHYRSQREELIHFSNKYFYNEKLKMIPHYQSFFEKDSPITYVNIHGEWKNRSNYEEALYIIDLLELLSKNEKTVGVITFNAPQRDLIHELWENKKTENSKQKDIELNDLFIKNIENVQGDERDIIIFSIGYGLNAKGIMNAHFGSLSQMGGENRLNVAITRAKQKIYIISSFEPEQLDVSKTTFRGPKLLKKFLIYAQSTTNNSLKNIINTASINNRNSTNYLSQSIHNYLNHKTEIAKSYQNLSLADLLVLSKNNHLGIINTDDENYKSSVNIKHAHVYQLRLLQSLGWKSINVFSRQKWRKPQQFEENILKFIHQIDN